MEWNCFIIYGFSQKENDAVIAMQRKAGWKLRALTKMLQRLLFFIVMEHRLMLHVKSSWQIIMLNMSIAGVRI